MTRTVFFDEAILVASEHVAFAELEGEAVLLDVSAGQYYGLNELGAVIMSHLKEPISLDALRARILAQFNVEQAQLDADLVAFLEEMVKYKLVQVKGDE